MIYRVLAHSRDNGQRMTLELNAKSKADAERQAQRQNLQIIRIEAASPEDAPPEKEWTPVAPRRAFKIPWLLLFLLLATGAIYYFWPILSDLAHRFQPKPHLTTAPAETS